MEVMSQLEGAFALLIQSRLYPGELIACKRGSPLLLGVKEGIIETVTTTELPFECPHMWGRGPALEVFVASDANAVIEHTKK